MFTLLTMSVGVIGHVSTADDVRQLEYADLLSLPTTSFSVSTADDAS